jgi:hypothetical protein
MADDNTLNMMQASMGVMGGMQMPMMRTPSPSETSMQLTTQAFQRSQALQAVTQEVTFGQQFRAQFNHIQGQQSMNPYMAQMMAQAMPGSAAGVQGYLPSPLSMTPPSTGVFRPPMAAPSMSPIAPMYVPPIIRGPLTPMPPPAQFMPGWERGAMVGDVQADRMESYGMAAPGALAQGATIGAGAYLGAQFGRQFGGRGALVGGIVGAGVTAMSGLAAHARDFTTSLMRPRMETRLMGAAIQRMSQDWVVQGPQLHAIGQGLSRSASLDMASQIKDMASSSQFQKETGGMFNREDLMKITQLSGQSGLMDMAQSVPQIKQRLKDVTRTVREFMMLTSDPDVTSVVRQMGKLQQFGITMPEMAGAARNMRNFARMAGTSIEGLQEIGGMPGAMTFQQAGLSAGSGFMYGNYSAAMARQTVASGAMDERRLAMFGGVQGLAQRNMQAQAALMSMPLYGASVAQYGAGGWGLNRGALGGSTGGAAGIVTGAANAMSAAVQRGGVGALASFPLEQRFIQDEAARKMSGYEMTAQRFTLAKSTGERMGLKGKDAFAFGSRMLYGDEVAEQMMAEGSSSGFWSSQREAIQREQSRLALNQRERIRAEAPGTFTKGFRTILRGTGAERRMRDAGRGWTNLTGLDEDPFTAGASGLGALGRGIGETFEDFGDWWGSPSVSSGLIRRTTPRVAAIGSNKARKNIAARALSNQSFNYGAIQGESATPSFSMLQYAQNVEDEGATGMWKSIGESAISGLGVTTGFAANFANEYLKDSGLDVIASAQGAALALTMTPQQQRDLARKSMNTMNQAAIVTNRAKLEGGSAEFRGKAVDTIKKLTGGKGDYLNLRRMGTRLALNVKTMGDSDPITNKDYDKAIVAQIASVNNTSIDKAKALFNKLSDDEKNGLRAQVRHYASQGDSEVSGAFLEREEGYNRKRAEQIDAAIESRSEAFSDAIGGIEKSVGLMTSFGSSSDAESLKSYIKEEAKNSWDVIGLAAAGGGTQGREEAAALFRKYNKGSMEGFDKWFEEREAKYAGLSDEQKAAFKKFGGRKGGLAAIHKYQQAVFAAPTSASLTRMFADQAGKGYGSGDLESLLTGGKAFTATDVAKTYSEDTLKAMDKAGGQQKELAKLLRQAKSGDQEAAAKITSMAVSKFGKEKTAEEAASKAGGEEARKLNESEEAIADAEMKFADIVGTFGPAAKDFADGAKMFRDAMESDTIGKLLED